MATFLLAGKLAIGLAVMVSVSGCATIQEPQIVYPPHAPRVISDYQSTTGLPYGGRRDSPHDAIDIEGRLGDRYGGMGALVLAGADGIVVRSHWQNMAGNRIVIEHGRDHDGNYLRTVYLHNSENLVQVGQEVRRGQIIAKVGATGGGSMAVPHLHFAVYRGPTKEYSNQWTHVDPHAYWLDGPYRLTCFDPKREYKNLPIRFTYPVECKE